MFFSFRSRLFAISLVVLAIFMVIVGLYLHQAFGTWTQARAEEDLRERAELVVRALGQLENPEEEAAFIEAMGGLEDQRITLVDADGTVLADTHLDAVQTASVESHSLRPEIRAAFDDGFGIARRHSSSVDTDMLYVALPTEDGQRALRLAIPLRQIDEALARLRLLLLVGGFLGIGVAILMSSIASKLMLRTLEKVLERVRATEVLSGEAPQTDGDSRSLRQATRALEDTLEQLANQRNRFRAVLNGMSEGVIATDEELRIILSNRRVRSLLQTDENHEGDLLRDLIAPELVELLVEGDEKSVEFEFDVAGPADAAPQKKRIQVRATPRPDSAGFIFVFHDVTEIRHLETMRRDFIANVSHELRTPVTIISANAETLLEGGALEAPEHARTFVEGIYRNSERLTRLIGDLLDLSRIEAGKIDLDVQSLPLTQVVERTSADVLGYTELEDRQIHSTVDEGLEVLADGEALQQILINLLENALKYGDESGPVEVSARPEEDMIIIEVKNEGTPIAEEHRDRLFERFYRVDPGRASKMGGTGLGLAIVKHLVTSLGGRLGYRAPDEGGSIFWFSLPQANTTSRS